MTLPQWTTSDACASRKYCHACLSNATWHAQMSQGFDMPPVGTCPHGVTPDEAMHAAAERRLDAEEAAFMRGDDDAQSPDCPCNSKRAKAPAKPRPAINLRDTFDRVNVISLARREDRWEAFEQRLDAINWPFAPPHRWTAVDGRKTGVPAWWTQGGGAWGCFKSHYNAIEQALSDGVSSLLLLEDDAVFLEDFESRVARFMTAVPDDWEMLYFGGQHLQQHEQPPQAVNKHVVKCYNVNRTHAWAIRGRMLKAVYRHLSQFSEWAVKPRSHIDHWLGELVKQGVHQVYAPRKWLIGQARGKSNVDGRVHDQRVWNGHRVAGEPDSDPQPIVLVAGLYRCGTTVTTKILEALGVSMGRRLNAQREPVWLRRQLVYLFGEPDFRELGKAEHEKLKQVIRQYALGERRRVGPDRWIGAKHPLLALSLTAARDALKSSPRVIIPQRSAAAVFDSMQCQGWPWVSRLTHKHIADMIERRQHEKPGLRTFEFDLDALRESPVTMVRQIAYFLDIKPDDEQIYKAAALVKPIGAHA